jgi:hypothetical protein
MGNLIFGNCIRLPPGLGVGSARMGKSLDKNKCLFQKGTQLKVSFSKDRSWSLNQSKGNICGNYRNIIIRAIHRWFSNLLASVGNFNIMRTGRGHSSSELPGGHGIR